MGTILHDSLLLALMFGSGFLLSRIFIKCGIAESLVNMFVRRSKGHVSRIIVYIVVFSAFLSMFIPNLIAVLAVLPLLEILKKDLERIDDKKKSLTTALAMANLYGSNIGGVGFIIGSLTNIIFITFAFLNKVEGAGKINFLTWIGWGVPFVIVFSGAACLVVILLILPKKLRRITLDVTHIHAHRTDYPNQKIAVLLSIVFFLFWVSLSIVQFIDKHWDVPYILTIAAGYFVAFNVFAFFVNFHDKKMNVKSRLLYASDIVSNMPTKGLILAAATIGITALLFLLNIGSKIYDLLGVTSIPEWLAARTHTVLLISLVLTTLTVFISEFMSNTATAITFMTTAVVLCASLNIQPLTILIGISVIATVPSMSPIASPVNAMAYGGIKGVSLRKMMAVGFVMDLIAVGLVNVWVLLYLPWYYRIHL
jgi:sodium-dependent dicarboxylate transporter 2/3/5